jgi:hypothetical protein
VEFWKHYLSTVILANLAPESKYKTTYHAATPKLRLYIDAAESNETPSGTKKIVWRSVIKECASYLVNEAQRLHLG